MARRCDARRSRRPQHRLCAVALAAGRRALAPCGRADVAGDRGRRLLARAGRLRRDRLARGPGRSRAPPAGDEAGDRGCAVEMLVPSPFWVSYPEQARLLGAVPVAVDTREATGFDLDPEGLRAAVTPRTKLIVLNSPNNPTGAVFSRRALEAVARLAVERGLWVVADECYESLTFEGRHVSIASLGPDIKARTLVVNPCWKAYAMTGWRIAYAAGPRELIRAMTDIQSQVTSNPSSI